MHPSPDKRVGTIPAHSATVQVVESGGGSGIRTHDTLRYSDLANQRHCGQYRRIPSVSAENIGEFANEQRFRSGTQPGTGHYSRSRAARSAGDRADLGIGND